MLCVFFRCGVAPYTGAWIEIPFPQPPQKGEGVAPYTGAWIEMHGAITN